MKRLVFLAVFLLLFSSTIIIACNTSGDDDDDDSEPSGDDDDSGEQWDQWDISVIDPDGLDGAIALDSAGFVHVAYQGQSPKQLKYATNQSGEWVIKELGHFGQGSGPAIAVDQDDVVHIAASGAYISKKSDDFFLVGDLPAGFNVNGYSQIVIDENGAVHLAFLANIETAPNADILAYATDKEGDWNFGVVFGHSGNLHDNFDMKVDSNGNAHIFFRDITQRDLLYANNATGAFTLEPVYQPADKIYVNAMTVDTDSSDNPHFAFSLSENGECMQYRVGVDGDVQDVDCGTVEIKYAALILDDNDNAYLSYHILEVGHLHFATNESGIWKEWVVDNSEYCGWENDLAMGEDGKAHIVYNDLDGLSLKYTVSKN